MIQKIERIKNIGNYEDYVASGDTTLKKVTLIYAENGAGKTTLARILYSLSQNDPTIIQRHKRIGATSNSEVYIRAEQGSISYNGNNWNLPMANIAVFDAHFVANNVYTGFHINNDHKKQLYKFVLGDAGVDTARKIERVKQMIESKNNNINSIINQITALCNPYFTDIDSLIKIKKNPNIENDILAKEHELQLSRDNDAILNHAVLSKINLVQLNINYNQLKKIISISINDIGQEYLDIVRNHISNLNEHNIDDASNWLYKGTLYISSYKVNSCPFCGQEFLDKRLIDGYNQYFSDKYKHIISEIDSFIKQLSQFNIQLVISNIHASLRQIIDSHSFWEKYMATKSQIPTIDVKWDELKDSFERLRVQLNDKKASPVAALPINIIDDYINIEKTLNAQLEIINTYIDAYNKRITEIKGKIRPINIIEKELHSLIIAKRRYDEPLLGNCNSIIILKRQLARLQTINKALQQQQKDISTEIVRLYGEKTNYYLTSVFGTKFKISEIKDGGIRGRAKESNLSYTLTFNGTPIEQEGDTYTSFKNVLSEGDKNTIAFSFFLAKLTTGTDLPNKIVVFDDPLTSLDLNRRNTTIYQLVLLYQQVKQCIILSHNLHFLIEINGVSRIRKQDKKGLQIQNVNGVSRIIEYQIKQEWIANYQKALNAMYDFLVNPSFEGQEMAINAIRISLETFLKLKYCRFIPDPDQTFGTIVSVLEQSPCSFVNANKSQVIDKLNQLVAISWRGHHGSVEDRDAYTDVNMTTAEAINYIHMTLDLLNSEL